MVQDIEGKSLSSIPTKENQEMAKQIAAASRKLQDRVTARRISEAEYLEIATKLREQKLDVTPTNVTITATPIIGRKFAVSEVTEPRMAKLKKLIRDLDATAEAKAKERLAGSVQGLARGDTVDLVLKGMIQAEFNKFGSELLGSVRKLLLAQELRNNQAMKQLYTGFEALAEEWRISIPPFEEKIEAPVLIEGTRVVRPPRILVYGIAANQKQPLYDKVREWGKHEVATIDVGYSSQRVVDMKRGYDVVIVNKHFVGMDDVRDLEKNHGRKIVTTEGSLSSVLLHLQRELVELEIATATRS